MWNVIFVCKIEQTYWDLDKRVCLTSIETKSRFLKILFKDLKVLKQTKAVRYKLSYSLLYWKVFEIRRIRGQKGLSAGTSLYNLGFVFKVLFFLISPCPASLAWDYVQAPSESRQMLLNKKETEKNPFDLF